VYVNRSFNSKAVIFVDISDNSWLTIHQAGMLSWKWLRNILCSFQEITLFGRRDCALYKGRGTS